MKKFAAALFGAMLLAQASAWAAPSDPFFSVQWGLEKIRADDAWRKSAGKGAVVAVIDTGVDPDHPDLEGRLLAGKDFVDGDNDARDENGHGTLIAGIIAASTGNGIGVASVAHKAKILPVRVLDEDGMGVSTDVADGIRWAVARGANVINLSLAQEGADGDGLLGDRLLRDPAVGEAVEDAARDGVTVVVAAGNDRAGGRNQTSYDARVDGVIVVGASTKSDGLAAYSNYGPGLDLLAPGGGSNSDPSESGCTQHNSIVSTWWDPKDEASKYGGGCGTSMAVGFASGVAAMLHARGLSNVKAVKKMISTAKDLGARGRDDRTGHGRLDAARALGIVKKASTSSPPPVKRTTPPPPKEDKTVKVQGDPDPIKTPSPTPTSAPTRSTRLPEPPPPVAFPAAIPDPSKGWPVTAAAGLVSLLVLLHAVRFVRQAEARAGR